jgi:hypothetical protein
MADLGFSRTFTFFSQKVTVNLPLANFNKRHFGRTLADVANGAREAP